MAEALERVMAALAGMTAAPWHAEESETMAGVLDGPKGAGGHPNESPFVAEVGFACDVENLVTLRNDTAQALAEARAEGVRTAWLEAAECASKCGETDLAAAEVRAEKAEAERDALAQWVAELEAGVRRMAVGGGCQWHGCYQGQGIDPTTGDREDVEHSDVCPIYFTEQALALLAGPATPRPPSFWPRSWLVLKFDSVESPLPEPPER
jgi:hypothetical protein